MPEIEPEVLQDLTQLQATNELEEGKDFSIRELWEAVQRQEDIIIEIDAIEEIRVRKGLSSAKAKQNQKLKDNDLPTDDSILEFKKHEDDSVPKGRVKLQIYLQRPEKIKVHKLTIPDGEL